MQAFRKQHVDIRGTGEAPSGARRFVLCFPEGEGVLCGGGMSGRLQVHPHEAVLFSEHSGYSFFADDAWIVIFSVEEVRKIPLEPAERITLFSRMRFDSGNDAITLYFRGLSDGVLQRVRDLSEEYEGRAIFRDPILLYELGGLLLRLIRNIWRVVSLREETETERTRRMLGWIRDHFTTVTLEKLAEEFSCHPNTAAAMLKRNTGRTFSELVLEMRMARVLEEIREGKTVNEAAEGCGYSNMSNFYRRFKQYYGKTPAEMMKGSGKEGEGC